MEFPNRFGRDWRRNNEVIKIRIFQGNLPEVSFWKSEGLFMAQL
jgi:hypothetical protein